jgi:hypothetical protein
MRPFHYERRHLRGRCVGHNMSPSTNGRMTTNGDTSDRRCVGHNMSPSSDRLMITDRDTSYRRCEDHDMSPSTYRRMMTSGDTSDRRCVGHNMSPSSDRRMTTSGDTLDRRSEGHDISPVQNAPEPMWWLDMSGQVYSQWSGYDEYGDKCQIDFHGYCPHAKDQWARRHLPWTISGWLVER